jgi:hypothetical protein
MGRADTKASFYAYNDSAITAPPVPTVTATATTTTGPTITPAPGNAITTDRTIKYQTVEGLGFFNPKQVWWNSGDANAFVDDAWNNTVLDDLGLSTWRNELYPHIPIDQNSSTESQDAYWGKQKPMIQAFKAKADSLRVPLRVILTVWSPPSNFKWWCTFSWARDKDISQGGTANRGPSGNPSGT